MAKNEAVVDEERCRHIKDNGERCGTVFGLSEDTHLCFQHDPDRIQERYRAKSRGGKTAAVNRSRSGRKPVVDEEAPSPPKTLQDAVEWASWTTWAVATGRIDGKTAHDIGYMLRAFMSGQRDLDRVDERVRELKKELAKLRKSTE
jgi:hypothetical protein